MASGGSRKPTSAGGVAHSLKLSALTTSRTGVYNVLPQDSPRSEDSARLEEALNWLLVSPAFRLNTNETQTSVLVSPDGTVIRQPHSQRTKSITNWELRIWHTTCTIHEICTRPATNFGQYSSNGIVKVLV